MARMARYGRRTRSTYTPRTPKPESELPEGTTVEVTEVKERLTGEHRDVKTLRHVHLPDLLALTQINVGTKHGKAWTFGDYWPMEECPKKPVEEMRMGIVPERIMELYQEARNTMEPLVEKFVGNRPTVKRRRVRREEGDELLIDHVMTGDPACWEKRVRGRKKQVVRFGIRFNASSGDDEADFARTGALAAAGADALQQLGYGVEIWAVAGGVCSWRSTEEIACTLKLKGSMEPLDVNAVLCTALPNMSRYHVFKVWEWSAGGDSQSGCYVHPFSKPMREFMELDYVFGRGAVVDQSGQTVIKELHELFTEGEKVLRAKEQETYNRLRRSGYTR